MKKKIAVYDHAIEFGEYLPDNSIISKMKKIQDHHEEQYEIKIINDSSDIDNEIDAVNAVINIDADISICHFELENDRCILDGLSEGSILISISSHGSEGRKTGITKNGVYQLVLQEDYEDLYLNDWEMILESLTNDSKCASKIVRSEYQGEIRKFFQEQISFEIFSTLIILCQGAIAVYADPKMGKPERLSRAKHSDVEKALKCMNYPTDGSAKSLFSEIVINPTSREQLQKEVLNPEWWDCLNEISDLEAKAETEWSFLKDKTGDLEVLHLLLRNIQHKKVIDIQLVARCFLLLADKFEK